MIKAIKVQKQNDNTYFDENENRLVYLSSLNRINIFIGENNSSKSRLLRELIKQDNDAYLRDVENSTGINKARTRLINGIDNFNKLAIQKGKDELVFDIHNKIDPMELFLECVKQVVSAKYNVEVDNQLKQLLDSVTQSIANLESSFIPSIRYANQKELKAKMYVPVLRGIESFHNYYGSKSENIIDDVRMTKNERTALEEYKNSVKDIYRSKISKVYGVDENLIFTGENLYEEIMNKLLGKEQDRRFVSEFQSFISMHFYEGQAFQLFPQKEGGYLNVKIGKTAERPLHDLGDGIKQIICMLYKVFEFRNQEAIFFIEEPEMNLHPAYQRKLIEILQNDEFEKAQFFITTHSNHFVDSCFNHESISIFKFININNKNNRFKIIKTTKGDIELLNLLGVNNSSVFMANSTIWVEGLSDKIYIKKYLQVYMESRGGKQYVEDVDYSFVEYGGNNIVHWSFVPDETIHEINVSGITNRLFLIADNDNDKKKRRKEKLRSILGDCFYELTVREIENTIKPSVLEKTLFSDGNIITTGRTNCKNKTYIDNQAKVFEFVDEHYVTDIKYWDEKRGATQSKIDFAKRVVENINSVEDLSAEAVSLCEAICAFLDR